MICLHSLNSSFLRLWEVWHTEIANEIQPIPRIGNIRAAKLGYRYDISVVGVRIFCIFTIDPKGEIL